MTIRHIAEREDRYIITTRERRRRAWSIHLDDLNTNGRAEVAWLKSGHGYGIQIGRNGSDSDIGLDVYAGKLGSVWLRLRSPWTKWARVNRDAEDWYVPRHTGIRLMWFKGRWISVDIESREGQSSTKDPWWREIAIGKTQIVGRTSTETIEGDTGETAVPMPEGTYPATWTVETYRRRYVRWPFRLLPAHDTKHVRLDIPAGIPAWGKGENSWDCGMDGLFGTSGTTLEDAVGRAVASSLRSRDRNGGPHNLPAPMTLSDAEAWATSEGPNNR